MRPRALASRLSMVAIFVGRIIEAANLAVLRTDIVIVRPTPVFGAGDHHHPKELCLLTDAAVGDDEGWAVLASVSICIRKRHTNNISLLKGRHRPGDPLLSPTRKRS
jgi:hypothetical protein